MREYKFRGKRLDNGEWVYGSLYGAQYQETGKVGIMTAEQAGDVAIIDEVFSQTVGQYAEIKDDDKNDIYEGDIVELCGHLFEVVYDYSCFMLNKVSLHKNKNSLHWINTLYWRSKAYSLNVVGNIHDNPELLEGD